jgi:hypothetical protein
MPFKKVGSNDYTGPSGKHFNLNQVRLYYAHGGSFPAHAGGGPVAKKEPTMAYAKGSAPSNMAYAAGGPVLGRSRSFLKEPDEFRDPDEGDATADKDQLYAKSGEGAGTGVGGKQNKRTGDKSMKAVKPRG